MSNSSLNPSSEYRDAVLFYKDLRKLMYEEINQEFPVFHCSLITMEHARQADSWMGADHSPSRNAWSWVNAYQYYTDKKRFRRFDLSICGGGRLVGLSYGMPSQAKTKLKVNLIEATPFEAHKQNTRIFEVISEAAQIYAYLLGADEVRIMRPVNEDVAKYYCSFGYEYVEPIRKNMPVYCSLKL